MTDIPRQLTGVFKVPTGASYANETLTWYRNPRGTGGQGGSVIADDIVQTTTDAAGAIDFSVVAGDYLVMIRLVDEDRYFRVVVPDTVGPHDVSTLVGDYPRHGILEAILQAGADAVSVGGAAGAHITNQENPHAVTAAQVGAATPEQVSEAVGAHASRTDNPHGVTKEQLGLTNVNNTSDSDKPVSSAQQKALDAIADGAGWQVPTIGRGLAGTRRTVWDRAGALFEASNSDGEPGSFAQAAHRVPVIGFANSGVFARDGGLIEAVTRAGPLGAGPFMVPQIRGLRAASWTLTGDMVDLERGTVQTDTIEQHLAAASITGRQLPQIYLKRSDAQVTALTGGPFGAELISADAATGSAVVRRMGRQDRARWRVTPVSDGTMLHLVLVMGQSLAQGFVDASPAVNGVVDRYPLWRDPVDERALMFAPGDGIPRGPRPLQLAPDFAQKDLTVSAAQLAALAPLTGAAYGGVGKYGQTAAESCAASLLWQHLHPRDLVLAAVVGTGSTAIADFAAGTEHMASAEAIIARVDEIAGVMSAGGESRGWTVWLVWNQGEQDNIDGSTQAAYVSAWKALRDHLSGVVTAAGGTFGGSVIQQTEQRQGGAVGMATLAQAELVTSGEASFVPHYSMLPGHSGAAHLFPATYLPLGSGTAWAISEIIAGNGPGPYVASGDALLVNATTIDVTFTGAQGTMVFDVSTIPDDGQKGVAVTTSGGNVAITSLAWTGAATLRLTLGASVLIGDAPVVKFGLTGTGTALLPNPEGPRVNIRDGSDWPCPITGQPVSGWVLQHQTAVVAA